VTRRRTASWFKLENQTLAGVAASASAACNICAADGNARDNFSKRSFTRAVTAAARTAISR